MWPFVLYLWALERVGIAELYSTDLSLQRDLINQAQFPRWTHSHNPLQQWAGGNRGLLAGGLVAGMRRASEECATDANNSAPAQTPDS